MRSCVPPWERNQSFSFVSVAFLNRQLGFVFAPHQARAEAASVARTSKIRLDSWRSIVTTTWDSRIYPSFPKTKFVPQIPSIWYPRGESRYCMYQSKSRRDPADWDALNTGRITGSARVYPGTFTPVTRIRYGAQIDGTSVDPGPGGPKRFHRMPRDEKIRLLLNPVCAMFPTSIAAC